MTRRRKRLLIAGLAVIAAALFVAFSGLWTRVFGEGVVNNALVGLREDEVRRRYGEPKSEKPGYSQLGLGPVGRLPDGPIKTLIFKPRGLFYLEGGTYWVWFAQRDRVWVCFESCWFADGVQF